MVLESLCVIDPCYHSRFVINLKYGLGVRMKNMHPKNRLGYLRKRRGIVGLEAAIVLIAFVIIAAAFSFMVVNQGLFATERGKTVIQEGLKQASTPLTMDGSTFVRTMKDGDGVDVIVIPVRAFGVKYVAMWKNETVVALKVGKSAWANVYGGVLYEYSGNGDVTDEVIDSTPDGALLIFGGTLVNPPIVPGSLKITATVNDSPVTITDNAAGVLTGTGVTGTIDYVSGVWALTWGAAPGPDAGTVIIADYKLAEDVGIAVVPPSSMNLAHENLVPGSETIYADGTALVRTTDYTIDYDLGEITWVTDQTGNAITADYMWANRETFDPSGYKFDNIVGLQYDSRTGLYYNGAYSSGAGETVAILALENSNGDESLDSFEKGYLIVTLASEDAAKVRAAITIEIRLEKTAPLSIEFNIPEAMPKDTWVLT